MCKGYLPIHLFQDGFRHSEKAVPCSTLTPLWQDFSRCFRISGSEMWVF